MTRYTIRGFLASTDSNRLQEIIIFGRRIFIHTFHLIMIFFFIIFYSGEYDRARVF